MKRSLRAAGLALLAALILPAQPLPPQTLEAAQALQKDHRYQEANDIYKKLVADHPDNADGYRVAWGRMYLEHWQPDIAGQLFDEALKIKPDDAGAFMGLALIQAEEFGGKAGRIRAHGAEVGPAYGGGAGTAGASRA